MTRGSLRARLRRLESSSAGSIEPLRLWWADLDAGLWREGLGPGAEGKGEAQPMTPEELADLRASDCHAVRLTGLPQGRR